MDNWFHQKWIMDIYLEFLQLLKDNSFEVVFIPASYIGELHPLDVSRNHPFKYTLALKFNI